MPMFTDPPYPFNRLSKGFASTFECYQCSRWLLSRPNVGQMTYKLGRPSCLSFVEALYVLHAVWSLRPIVTKCLDPHIHSRIFRDQIGRNARSIRPEQFDPEVTAKGLMAEGSAIPEFDSL